MVSRQLKRIKWSGETNTFFVRYVSGACTVPTIRILNMRIVLLLDELIM